MGSGNYVRYVRNNGYVSSNGNQGSPCVVAPAFNLDTSKVKLVGNEIVQFTDITVTEDDLDAGTNTATRDVPVKATCTASFTVSLPAELTLTKQDDNTYVSEGKVKVKGSILSDSSVEVSAGDTVTLTDATGRKSVSGTVTQSETSWSQALLSSTESSGNFTYESDGYFSVPLKVSVQAITAGDWSGNITFTIKYN